MIYSAKLSPIGRDRPHDGGNDARVWMAEVDCYAPGSLRWTSFAERSQAKSAGRFVLEGIFLGADPVFMPSGEQGVMLSAIHRLRIGCPVVVGIKLRVRARLPETSLAPVDPIVVLFRVDPAREVKLEGPTLDPRSAFDVARSCPTCGAPVRVVRR